MFALAVTGLAAGIAYSALGLCLVLVRQVSDLIDISQGIVGGIGAYVMLAVSRQGLGLPLSCLVGLLAGAALSASMGAMHAQVFARTDATTRTAVAIGSTVTLLAVAQRIFGHDPKLFPVLLGGHFVSVGNAVIATVNLVAAAVLVGLGALLHFGLRHSRVGVRLWAVSLRPTTSELLGVRRRLLTVSVWAGAGALSTAGLLVVMPTRQSDLTSMTLLVVPALAAALIGGMQSYPGVLVSGVLIGLCEALLLEWPSIAQYRQALSFAVIVLVLLVSQRWAVWDESR